jgi:hypothetical protein
MRWFRLLPLALLGAAAACAPKLTRQQAAVEQQVITGQLQLWERGMISLKPDSMALVYEHSQDFMGAWPDGKRTHGWQEEEQAQKDFAANTQTYNFDVQDAATQVLSTSIAVTTFGHGSDVTDKAGRGLYQGAGTIVWLKDPQTNAWLIHAIQVSRNPSAGGTGQRR